MSTSDSGTDQPQHLRSLRRYVRSPLSAATRRLERERAEVARERQAFETFLERVRVVEPVAETEFGTTTLLTPGRRSDRFDRIRAAYRETVMDVDHYEAAYGDTMDESIAAELGPELAEGLRADEVDFTRTYKAMLVSVAATAMRDRDAICTALEEERESLAASRERLDRLVDDLDGSVVPAWYGPTFEAKVEATVRDRQETLHDHGPLPNRDSHSFCTYLYRDQPWTYPVLTAATRLIDTVVLKSTER